MYPGLSMKSSDQAPYPHKLSTGSVGTVITLFAIFPFVVLEHVSIFFFLRLFYKYLFIIIDYVAKVTRPNGPIKVPDNAHYEINFASWAKYSVRPGFYRYGCITYYDTQKNPVGIWWPEKSRLVLPHEPDYPLACLIFRSTLITVATIQDHLIKVHWIVGNSGVVNAERYLGKNHLVRRFLKPHIYGTVAINFGSTVLLAPVDGLAYRVFAFDKNSWIPMVLDCFQAFRYESLRERMTRQGLTDQDVVDIPFYHDGFAFEQIMEEYITAYLALIYPTENDDLALQQDKELHDFWQGYVSYFGKMKESHGIEFQQLGNLTRSNLIRLLTHHLFWVTGGHQYLGYVIEYLNANGAMPSKVCIDLPKKKKITLTGTGEKDKEKKEKEEEVIQIHSDVQTMLQSLSLMALTSGPQPMLIDAWEHLWHDKQLTMTDTLKKSIVENLHTWQQALRNLSGKIDEWNKARIQPFDAFNPKLIESSVSV